MQVHVLRNDESPSDEDTDALNRLMARLSPGTARARTAGEWRACAKSCALIVARDPVTFRQIIGSAAVIQAITPLSQKAWVEDVVALPEWEGKGVGRALVEFAIRYARIGGTKYIDLTSREKRARANTLYLELGFELRETNVYRLVL